MDETRLQTILQNMGTLLLKTAEATRILLEGKRWPYCNLAQSG